MPTITEVLAKKSGKPAAAPAKATGAAGPKLKADPAIPDKKPEPKDRRSLSTTCGEDIPPNRRAETPDELAWDSTLQALDTELCIVPDPDPRNERAWIAIRRPDRPNEKIHLFALPMFPAEATEDVPF